MAPRELVDYTYIANELGVLTETVRHMALDARKKRRHALFPTPTNPKARSPLFDRTAADTFIADRLKTKGPNPGRPRDTPENTPSTPIPADTTGLVDRHYFAQQLGITAQVVTMYRAPRDPHFDPTFPTPATPPRSRTPLWHRIDADAYIAARKARGNHRRGRLRANTNTPQHTALAAEAAAILGREIDLEDRGLLQQVLFEELDLPATKETSRGPSVATVQLRRLQEAHPHPFVEALLRYRDVGRGTAP